MLQQYHPALNNLIQLGKDRGWLSYEEVNNTIPDEMIEPVVEEDEATSPLASSCAASERDELDDDEDFTVPLRPPHGQQARAVTTRG